MSERSDFTASARVRVMIEVLNLGPYGADWKAGDIHDQVARDAEDKSVRRELGKAKIVFWAACRAAEKEVRK